MSDATEKAKKDLDKAYEKVRNDLGHVFVAIEDVRNAEAEDDLYGYLEKLEDAVKDARTGGLIGSGAKKHRKAREKWLATLPQPNPE